jgi:hypothetical protein
VRPYIKRKYDPSDQVTPRKILITLHITKNSNTEGVLLFRLAEQLQLSVPYIEDACKELGEAVVLTQRRVYYNPMWLYE